MNSSLKSEFHKPSESMGRTYEFNEIFSMEFQGVSSHPLCCDVHWPYAWSILANYLVPNGHLVDHGDTVIEKDGFNFVFKHKESGAEIIAYLEIATAVINLTAACIGLVAVLIAVIKKQRETRRNEAKDMALRFIFRRKIPGQQQPEEEIIEMTLPASRAAIGQLGRLIMDFCRLQNDKETPIDAHKIWAETEAAIENMAPSFDMTFRLQAPEANSVKVAGSFNNWSGGDMLTNDTGEWTLQMRLPKSKHLYKFIVDGNWRLDPVNIQTEQDERGNMNSVITNKD